MHENGSANFLFLEKTALGGQEIRLQRPTLKFRTKLAKLKGWKSGYDAEATIGS